MDFTDHRLPIMRTYPITVLILALVFLAGCSSGNKQTGTSAALPIASPRATSTPSPLPPVSTATHAAPTATTAPSVTPTATTTPTLTPSPTSTPVALAALTLTLESLVEDLEQPVFAGHAGDGSGRIFVLEKGGRIVAFDAGGTRADFLDITGRVGANGSEQGLLGVAFAPDFAASGRFYVNYTDRDGNTVIARFQADAERGVADPDSEAVLLTVEQPASNHNGGMMAFGPDGYLYIGLGDGGGAGDVHKNAQNLGTLLGSILRIDVSGDQPSVPADNPFTGQKGARPETWAYGLRNPWRFSFDRATGDLWIGDVGQGDWEEIDFQPASSTGGENYGWPLMEGTHCYNADTCDQSGLVLPVAEYEHEQGCAVTGGYVYRGAEQPALQGIYFYGDYCTGRIWGRRADAPGQESVELLDSEARISSFGETESGELLVVDYSGTVYLLRGSAP